VKTRLQPEFSPAESLALHRALVEDAIDLVRGYASRAGLRAEVSLAGPLADGEPIAGALHGVEVSMQQGADLGERLARAFQAGFGRRERRIVVIGSDSPTLGEDYLRQAFEALEGAEVVVGPAEDGGYVLIGCARLHPRLFQGVPWGGDRVLEETLRRLRRGKIPHVRLRAAHDLDTPDDLRRTWRELEHLERVGAARAPRTLAALREIARP
jgi:hypothetical protein